MTGLGIQSFLATALVLALVGALAFVARRGGFGALNKRGPVSVETAVPLGERRSLVVVAVEGRRLLLGLTPASVSMLAELNPVKPAQSETPVLAPFEQELKQRT
jgi:flagellar biosynthetic protein FliO